MRDADAPHPPDGPVPAFLRAAYAWQNAPDDGARLDALMCLLAERERLYGATHETADMMLRELQEAERATIAAGLCDLREDTHEIVSIISQGIAAQNLMVGEPLLYERKANTLIRDYLRFPVSQKFKDAAVVTLDYIAVRHAPEHGVADRVVDTIRQVTGYAIQPRARGSTPTVS